MPIATDPQVLDRAERLAMRIDDLGLRALDLDTVDFVNQHGPAGAATYLKRVLNDPTENRVIRLRALTMLLAVIIRRGQGR